MASFKSIQLGGQTLAVFVVGTLLLCATLTSAASFSKLHTPRTAGEQVDQNSRLSELETMFQNFQEEFSRQKQELENVWSKFVEQESQIQHLEAVVSYQSKQLNALNGDRPASKTSTDDDESVTPSEIEQKEIRNIEQDLHLVEEILSENNGESTDSTTEGVLKRHPRPHGDAIDDDNNKEDRFSKRHIRRLERRVQKQERQINLLMRENRLSDTLEPKALEDESQRTQDNTDPSSLHKRDVRRFDTVRSEPINGVAFSAFLETPARNLYIKETLVMGGMLLNDGNDYDPSTGVFTCRESGVYMFTFFVLDVEIEELNVMLVLNGANKMGASAEPKHFSQDAQGGNAAILRLRTGDRVWLRTMDVSGVSVYGSNMFRDSSFSGVLLYR